MFTSTLLSAVLVINELMASNVGEVMSPAANFDSWIEIYNTSNQAVNLGGMYLSDDPNNLKQWQMPSNMGSVPANGYKVVWLGSHDIKIGRNEEEVGKLQAPFKLDCDGGTIYLSDNSGALILSQEYPEAMSHTAWARKTDGGDDWGWTNDITPGESNVKARFANERLDAPVVSVDSKIFTSSLNIKVDIPEGATLMYTTDGSLPKIELPWKDMLTNGSCEGSDASCFISRDGDGTSDANRIVDGVGYNGSRGIRVHTIANAPNDWKSQFFVYTPNHTWKTGERYRFRMMVKADKASRVTVQAHRTPGDYITNGLLGGSLDVTTEWKEFVYEGTVTKEQADEQTSGGGGGGWGGGWGGWGGWDPVVTTYALQTIAFNLNVLKDTDNNFYFDDISWETYEDISSLESKDGEFAVSSTSSYTFRLFKDGYLPSVPVTRSYIKTSNKYTLPVISIVGDKKFFTDPKIGFDCDGDGTNGVTGNGQDQPRNYNQDWDRPVNFSYLSPDGEMLFNQDVNICTSGGWTRSQRFRSFKLKSSKIFDGQNRFDYSFFPQKPYIRSKVLLIRNGGNDVWVHNARFMDPALETIIQRSGIDLDVQSYVPVIEYVNGELRGVLNMREPNNDKFADANWGYDDEELDAFENMKMKNGNNQAIERIFELGRNATDDSAYEELKTLLDIDEFTNYMAVTMFLDNDDWPNNNIKAYRSQHDGRYRFVSFDLDYAFALRGFNKDNDDPFKYFARFKDATTVYDEGNANREIVRLLFNLLERDDYRRKFIDTFCLIGGSVFEPNHAGIVVDELLANVQAMCQLMRQMNLNEGSEPSRAANTIKSKLRGRSKKMTDCLKNFSAAKLSNAAQAVTLSAATPGAHIYVNGLDVPYAEFNGHLFAPVKLSVKAPAGFRFAGWKNGNTVVSTDEEINLPTGDNVNLTATFTSLSEQERLKKDITPVRINEVSASNEIYVNEYFKKNDWIELYNTTSKPIDVKGMYLSDNIDKPHKYQIGGAVDASQSTLILPYSHLVVWCDKLDPLTELHTSFKLAAEGGDVLLTAQDDSWSDRLTYTEHKSDETVGRFPDGTNNVFVMNVPTIAKTNIISSYAVVVEQAETAGIYDILADNSSSLSLRYAQGKLVVRGQADETAQVNVYSNTGQMAATFSVQLNNGYAEISIDELPAGYYVGNLSDKHGRHTVCKFVKN